jgi:hypothetical protein
MHADDTLGPFGRLGDLRHRQRRRVCRQHGVRSGDAVELGKRLPLELAIFEYRLDDEIAVGEVGKVGGEHQAGERCVALSFRQTPLLDPAGEVAVDGRASALAKLLADLTPYGVEARVDAHLRNPRTHRPEPDDAYLPDRHLQVRPSQEPAKRDLTVPGLVLRNDFIANDLQAGFRHQPSVCLGTERGEEHRRAEPIVFDVLPGLAGSERREQVASGPQPEADPRKQMPLLRDRNVAEKEECDNRVERSFSDVELGRVRVDEARFGNVVSRKLDLHRRDVDAGDPVPARELAGHRNASTATELEYVRAFVQTRIEVAHPVERRRLDLSRPLCVAQRDRVVTASDDLLRFPRDCATCRFPHLPQGNCVGSALR